MRAIFTPLTLLVCLMLGNILEGQSYFTSGDKSPIIKGTKAYIEYRNETDLQNISIPDELMPLLAGLLLENDKSIEEAQPALEVWINKYKELQEQIGKEKDSSKKERALQALRQSDFVEVEQILGLKTNYNQLLSTFSNSYSPNTTSTSGAESPIIIGDYATVKYVVNQVVKYQLPEGVTVNLLRELKSAQIANVDLQSDLTDQSKKIVNLETSLKNKDQVILDWISQYNEVKNQLRNTPGELAQQAFTWFERGNLKKAMEVLNQIDESKEQMGRASFLQAKILSLQVKGENFDKLSKEILTYYQQAAALSQDVEIHIQYATYLVSNQMDANAALRVLQAAEEYQKSDKDRFLYKSAETGIYHMLGNFEASIRAGKTAIGYSEQIDVQNDTLLLSHLNACQVFMANSLDYQAQNLQPVFGFNNGVSSPDLQNNQKILQLLRRARTYDSLSLQTVYALKARSKSPPEVFTSSELISLNNIAFRTSKIDPPAVALKVYEEVYRHMANTYSKSLWAATPNFVGFLNAYSFYLCETGDFAKAEKCSEEALAASLVTLDTRMQSTFNLYHQTAITYAKVLGMNNKNEVNYQLSKDWLRRGQEFLAINPTLFEGYVQLIIGHLTTLCYRTGRFEEGAQLSEKLFEKYEMAPTPSYQFVAGSVSSIIRLTKVGIDNYTGAKNLKAAKGLIERAIALLRKLRNVHGHFHSMVDHRILYLQCLDLDLDQQMGQSTERALLDIRQNSFSAMTIDPINSVGPFIAASKSISNLRTAQNSYSKKEDLLCVKSAKEALLLYIPQKDQIQFFLVTLKLDNEILRHYIARNDLNNAATVVEYMEGGIDGFYNLQSDWNFLKMNGTDDLYKLRLFHAEGYAHLAQYYAAKAQKTKKSKRAPLLQKACTQATKSWNRLGKEWKTIDAQMIRLALKKLNEDCNCGGL